MDGVNGVTECPLAPGQTKKYRFQATQYGTTWYHSHYSVQYGDGLWGTMIINGPSTANYDIDLGTFPLTDWFYSSIFTVNAAALHANGPPTADNVLVNGTMTSAHGGKYAVTTLTPGKSHLLRIINVGINNYLTVGIDGHKMKVITSDFTPIVPYEADSITLAVGKIHCIPLHHAISTLPITRPARHQASPRKCTSTPCNLTLTHLQGSDTMSSSPPTAQSTITGYA